MKKTYPLEIVRGTNNTFVLNLYNNETGAPYTLAEGQALVFGLKVGKTDDKRLLVKPITDVINGDYHLSLYPEETADLEPGRYYYDIGLQDGSEIFYNVIQASAFTILPNITQLGDGG